MNTLRRIALRLAKATNRFASSGQKEWTKAMLHELESIEGDWTAFLWAVSGSRVLLKPYKTHTPIRSLSELPHLTKILAARLQKRQRSALMIFVVESIWFAYFIRFLAPWPVMRLGCALVYAAVIFVSVQILLRRPRSMPSAHNLLALRNWYWSELQRQHEFHSGGWMWLRIVALFPGPLLFCFGFWLFHPTPAYALAGASILALFFVFGRVGLSNQQRQAALYQIRIQELDALKSETL